MTFQVNWRVWHWPWWHRNPEVIEFPHRLITYYSNFAGFGPFQFHWYS